MNELSWVQHLKVKAGKSRDVLVGIGDDCAQVRVGRQKILLKSDLFVEDVHFKRGGIDYRTIGQRAVCRVLSDFAACGGRPKFIGVSAGVPAYLKQEQLEEILDGVLFCSKKYKFSLIGGDTSRAAKLFLDVWGAGTAERCVLRSGAKAGDYIFITGPLGKRALTDVFTPRLKEAQALIRAFKVTAMIDISDGFILDLSRLLTASGKGAVLYKDKIPLTRGESDLYRGEDYELIFTVDSKEPKRAYLKRRYCLVGEIKDKRFGYKFKVGRQLRAITPAGYTHPHV